MPAWCLDLPSLDAHPSGERVLNQGHVVAGMPLHLAANDAAFLSEFSMLFGGVQQVAPESASLHGHVVLEPDRERVVFRIWGDSVTDPASILVGLQAADVPIREVEAQSPWRTLALGDDLEPVLAFHPQHGVMRAIPRWRRILSHIFFLRLLRLRPDVLFLHAASVAIGGRGILLIGPKGTGKTTLSLALAGRGHDLLGDETGAYTADGGSLLPMQRPVAVKPGPRARTISAALARYEGHADPDGLLRVPIDELLPGRQEPAPAPLHFVVFLDGFGPEPRLERVVGGREELARMQPLLSAASPGAQTAKVFAMVRLLGSAACFRLVCGDPDETAAVVEGAVAS